VGAVGAAVTGLNDWQYTVERSRRIGAVHAVLNTGAAALYTTSLVHRRRGDRDRGFAFALAGFTAAAVSAWLGGHLVYKERIGVDHSPEPRAPKEFTPVLSESDLPEGGMRKVEVDRTPILLARTGGRVHAIAETCAHEGGPLSEGTLEDGIVQCPWHGSRFHLEDGSIASGPTVFPQPCFEVRIRDGRIEVRIPVSA
jgi:nitrite reductase/ring-hydroxylating ferredoxin subunit